MLEAGPRSLTHGSERLDPEIDVKWSEDRVIASPPDSPSAPLIDPLSTLCLNFIRGLHKRDQSLLPSSLLSLTSSSK